MRGRGKSDLLQVITFLWDRLGNRKGIFLTGIILNFSQAVSMMLDPLFVSLLISKLEIGDYKSVPIYAGGFFLLLILLSLTALISEYIKLNSVFGLNTSLMGELADKSQRIPFERAQDTHSSDLLQRITYDTPRVTSILTIIFDKMADQLFMLILAAIYLLWANWIVAACVLFISPCMLAISYFLQNKLQVIGEKIAIQESKSRQIQQDSLQAIDVIKAFGVEEWFVNRFYSERRELNRLYMRRMRLYQSINIFTTVVSNFVIIATVLILSFLYIDKPMALGSMIVYFTLVWRVNSPLQNIGSLWGQLQEQLGASKRILDLLSIPDEPNSSNPLRTPNMGILLSDVSYFYPVNDDIKSCSIGAKNISLKIREGECVLLTGPSGSGKSTVGKLISGLLFPSQGSVSIAGWNPSEDAVSARNMVAYVPQFPTMFSSTIRENLLLHNECVSTEELSRISRILKIDEFVKCLPNGFETILHEKGKSLSGGQLQRLAIARALLSNRPVWVFDEATSALDVDTEREVIHSVISEAKIKKCTVIIIAHRLSVLKEVDKIVVMNDGSISQTGTHNELLEQKDSLYEELWLLTQR